MHNALGGAALIALLALGPALAAGRPPLAAHGCEPDSPPAGWKLDQIAEQTPPYGVDGEVYLLAWQIVEDDRPLRVESSLVMRVFDGGRSYSLAHLYRRPDDDEPEWRLAMTHVSPYGDDELGRMLFHDESFDHRPDNREIDAALAPAKVNWSFEIEEGWKLVAGGVCDRNWLQAIGEKPAHRFSGGK